MTSFDPTGGYKSPDEWRRIAFRRSADDSLQFKVIGGLVAAGMAAAAINPATGMLVAGWTIWSSVESIKGMGRNQTAVRDFGCIVHLLDNHEFRIYAKQIGSDALNAELLFAIENGLAENICDEGYEYISRNSSKLLPVSQPAAISPNYDTASAIPVISTIVQTDVESSGVPDRTIDIVSAISSPVQNCIIFGIGGSGKGMLVANAIRRIKKQTQNRKIFYIDPKDEPKEYGYTDGFVDVVKRKKCFSRPSEEICEWLDEKLDEYQKWAAQQEESLLIIDEGTILGAAAKKTKKDRVGSLITHISSLGGSSKQKVWLLAQSPFVGAMGLDLSSNSQMTSVCLVSEDNINAVKQWKRSAILETISSDELAELFRVCPIAPPSKKRAIFWGGTSRWYAMPILENYSAFNRDEDKPAGDSLSTGDRQALRTRVDGAATTTAPSQSQMMIERLKKSTASTLPQFVLEDLGLSPDMVGRTVRAIMETLKKGDHQDLFKRFASKDPSEMYAEMKAWATSLKRKPSSEEIKHKWLLLSGRQLNDSGVQMMMEKLGL